MRKKNAKNASFTKKIRLTKKSSFKKDIILKKI